MEHSFRFGDVVITPKPSDWENTAKLHRLMFALNDGKYEIINDLLKSLIDSEGITDEQYHNILKQIGGE